MQSDFTTVFDSNLEGDEYDSKVGSYHWDLDDMLPDAEWIGEDEIGEEIWKVGGEIWHWNNTDRCYDHVTRKKEDEK